MNVAPNAHSSLRPLSRLHHSQNGTETISHAFPPALETPGSIPPGSLPFALLHPRKPFSAAYQILIANPRLRFHASPIRITKLQFSNRERIAIFRVPWRMAVSCSVLSGFSGFELQASRLQNPWPPCGGRLIYGSAIRIRRNILKEITIKNPNRR